MMSKDGSEDVVEEEQEQEEVLATAVAPSPGVGAIRIRHILEKVSPPHSKEYRILLTEAGFDTLESLALPCSEFREDAKGALPQFKIQLNNTHIMKGFVAAGLHATRFPGGNVANCFNWTYERGNYAQTTSLYCSTKIRNLERRIQFIEALGPHSYTVKTAKESWPESLWPPVFDLNVLSATTEEESIELVQSLADQNVDMNAKDALLELGNELYFYQQYGYKFKDASSLRPQAWGPPAPHLRSSRNCEGYRPEGICCSNEN